MKKKTFTDSHSIVASFFEARGFTVFGKVKSMSANGHDLMVAKDSRIHSVEVKRIRLSGTIHRIDLLPTQRKSDLLAMVSDTGTVSVIPMSILSSKTGKTISLGSVMGYL